MKTISDVRAEMDQRYADGTAYRVTLPFDEQRGRSIRAATLALASLAPDRTGERVLDVGAGEGGIASFWPHHDIVGLEISGMAVEKAKAAFPDVRYRCGAIEEFELGAGEKPYELVVAQESIEHWTSAEAGLRAISQAISRTGSLILTTPNRDSLHCRVSRKLEMGEPPYCSSDHIHEFGYDELIELVESFGFKKSASRGVGLLPYWTMERLFGSDIRRLTDADEEVVTWFEQIGAGAPPEFAFIQCHRFERDLTRASR